LNRFKGKLAASAGVLALAGGMGAAALAGPASATTSTCTNIAHPTSPPIGCGGIYLPGLGNGTQPNASSLTLSATGSVWNSKVVIEPYSASDSSEDWTVFQYNLGGVQVKDPLDGQGEYVAMYTPDGVPLGHTGSGPVTTADWNSSANLCLSVEKPAGWKHWWTVLRTCSSAGAAFTPGTPNGGAGNPGIVTSANQWQVFSPVPVTGGYVLAEDTVSNGFHSHNTLETLNDTGWGGPGTWQMLYPESDTANSIWKVVGCTNPVTSLTPGFYNCP